MRILSVIHFTNFFFVDSTNHFDLSYYNFCPTSLFSSTYWSLGLKLLAGGMHQGSSGRNFVVGLYVLRFIMCSNSPFEYFLFDSRC